MKMVFIDTWGWISLYNKRESRHSEVKQWYREYRKQSGVVYTTDYILDETITLLFRKVHFQQARKFLERIDTAVQQNRILLERITPGRFEKAKRMRIQYQDKPRISFTDFTSMVVMEELDIRRVLTSDVHFSQVGKSFQPVP